MSRHSVPEELLLDYAAGALSDGPALAVALHIALNPAAQRTSDLLNMLGRAVVEDECTEMVDQWQSDHGLEPTLAKIDGIPVDPRPAPFMPRSGFEWAPLALARRLGPEPRWRRVLGGFEEMRIEMRDDHHRVSLLRLRPGRGLPVHRHVGAEYTLVLQGGYTDSTGSFSVGDFTLGPDSAHRPVADPGKPCIAMIVLEKPIVLTGPIGRWMNPLVSRDLL